MNKPNSQKLKDFPLFMSACKAICADSGCSHGAHAHMVNPEAETAEYTEGIAYAEMVFAGLAELTIGKFMPELPKMKFYEDLSPDDLVLEVIYLGMNDSSTLLLERAKCEPHEIWLIEHLLQQFFEGELHHRFTMPVPRKKPRSKGGNGRH